MENPDFAKQQQKQQEDISKKRKQLQQNVSPVSKLNFPFKQGIFFYIYYV